MLYLILVTYAKTIFYAKKFATEPSEPYDILIGSDGDVTVIRIVGNDTRSSDFRRSLQLRLSTLPWL